MQFQGIVSIVLLLTTTALNQLVSAQEDISPSSSPSSSLSPSTNIMKTLLLTTLSIPQGSISGNVKEDSDGDLIGDINLSTVSIQLLDRFGVVVRSTVTDSDGNYFFSGVPADLYSIREINRADVPLDVSDSDGANPNAILVSVGLGNAPLESNGNNFVDKRLPPVAILNDERVVTTPTLPPIAESTPGPTNPPTEKPSPRPEVFNAGSPVITTTAYASPTNPPTQAVVSGY
jgi:hypothetical protein